MLTYKIQTVESAAIKCNARFSLLKMKKTLFSLAGASPLVSISYEGAECKKQLRNTKSADIHLGETVLFSPNVSVAFTPSGPLVYQWVKQL